MSILSIAARYAAGELLPSDYTRQCLARIAALDGSLRAWAHVAYEEALAQAAVSDGKFRDGKARGLLEGVPLGVKDIVDVAGMPTRAGSRLFGREAAKRDAPAVARLRAAGAVLLGKTVTTELACFDPAPTRNPWNAAHTPGGSSSGSAAAVAAGMCPGAIGSQTGGSILRPAAYCGVVGFKPAFGEVPLEGVVPVSASLDHLGPIAGSVACAELLWRVLRGELPAEAPPAADSAPEHLAWLGDFFAEEASPETRSLFEGALGQIAAAGAEIAEAAPPLPIRPLLVEHRTLMAAEAAAVHRERFAGAKEQFGPRVAELIEEGLAIPPEEYARAEVEQRIAKETWSRWIGPRILLMPTTPAPAPDTSTTGDPRFNSPWSFLGLPALTLPAGLSSEGLPWGLQLVCGAGNEPALFRAAGWIAGVLPPLPLPMPGKA